MSLGETIAVARAYEAAETVGKVAMAPLERLYGSGHSRIMTRSFRPSCLRVKESAAKRESCAIRRWTSGRRSVRERRKEQVLPMTVAVETMNQL